MARSGLPRRLAAAAAVFVLSTSGAQRAGGSALGDVRAHRARLDDIARRLRVKRGEMYRAADLERTLEAQLVQTQRALAGARAELTRLDALAEAADARVAWERRLLVAATLSVRRHVAAYRRRIVQIYESGEPQYLDVLLAATSFSDFAERWEDLRFLIAADRQTIRDREQAQSQERLREAAYERAKLVVADLQVRAEASRARAAALGEERQNLLAVADRQRSAAARDVQSLDDLSASEERALERAIAERQRELEAQRSAPARAGSVSPARGSGRFVWPVHGPITSPFGYRTNPFGGAPDFHPGLDIAAPSGTPIVAADSGQVIIAGWVSGYGNYIAIDHGGGVSSAYGHCSRIDVSVGQDVQRGQVIGAVGSTGHSTGPHVHFEIRVNGAPVDPAPRLP